MSLRSLDEMVLPSLLVEPAILKETAKRVVAAVEGSQTLTIVSGGVQEFRCATGGRPWLVDVGVVPRKDALAAQVRATQNLPAGAVYTTVIESSADGALFVPEVARARDVIVRFRGGRVVGIEAASGVETVLRAFKSHDANARRISHIGIGLNEVIPAAIGWPLVEHIRSGTVWVAFGENRYLGGRTASSLNVDWPLGQATFVADGRTVVERGRLTV